MLIVARERRQNKEVKKMVAGFILEFLLLLVSMGLMLASCVEKSWNMAMIAYVLCALAAAIISALWFAALTTPAA